MKKISYKIKLTIADDFISGIILFNSLIDAISESAADLEKWCEDRGLSHSGCMTFLENREGIIEQMLQNGLNPFAGHENRLHVVEEADFMNCIVRIKHCIYDGYRMNLATWSEGGGTYKLLNGIKLTIPALFAIDENKLLAEKNLGVVQKQRPKYILCDAFSIKPIRNRRGGGSNKSIDEAACKKDYCGGNSQPSMYEIKSSRASAMDGYVDIDNMFI